MIYAQKNKRIHGNSKAMKNKGFRTRRYDPKRENKKRKTTTR
jgi:hypothetical protein